MVDFVPAGEDYFDYDDESFGDFEHEADVGDLSSFHGDVPLIRHTNDIKSNIVKDKTSGDEFMLLSDLQNAVIGGNLSAVKNFVSDCADRCNSILNSGWTPLAYASNFGHVKVVEALIDAGADVNFSGNDGCTAIMAACKCAREKDVLLILEKLFNKKANPLLCDKNNKTVLIYAVRSGKYDVVNLVLKHSQEVINHEDSKGWTALDWAISKSFENIVLLLLENGANVYDAESDCISALPINVQQLLKSLLTKSDQVVDKENEENQSEEANLQPTSSIEIFKTPSIHEDEIITINTGSGGDSYQKYAHFSLIFSLLFC